MDLAENDGKEKAFTKALRLLNYRPRSTSELAVSLKQAGFDKDEVGDTIKRLISLGYLDDKRFAEEWIRYRVNISCYAKARIKRELKGKGISSDTIENAFEENYDDSRDLERAMRIAEKQTSSYKGLDEQAVKRRLSGYLSRRGFSTGIIVKVCQIYTEK